MSSAKVEECTDMSRPGAGVGTISFLSLSPTLQCGVESRVVRGCGVVTGVLGIKKPCSSSGNVGRG